MSRPIPSYNTDQSNQYINIQYFDYSTDEATKSTDDDYINVQYLDYSTNEVTNDGFNYTDVPTTPKKTCK